MFVNVTLVYFADDIPDLTEYLMELTELFENFEGEEIAKGIYRMSLYRAKAEKWYQDSEYFTESFRMETTYGVLVKVENFNA